MCEIDTSIFRKITLENILAECAAVRDVTTDALHSKSRKRELVEIKHAYCIVAKELTHKTLEVIGALIERDHSTVLHAINNNSEIPAINEIVKIVIYKFKTEINDTPIL